MNRLWTVITLVGLFVVGTTVGIAARYLAPAQPRNITTEFTSDSIRFAAFGDWGTGNYRQYQVANALADKAASDGLDFVALLGDNFYPAGVSDETDWQWRYKFENMYRDALAQVPFYAVLGNHDYYGHEQAQINYSLQSMGSGRWQMPASDYMKVFGKANGQPLLRVIFLETSPRSRRHEYTARELESLLTDPAGRNAHWTIIATHAPIRSGRDFYARSAEALRDAVLPVIARHSVDVYIAGHDHNLQLLNYPDEPLHIVSGAGGKYGNDTRQGFAEGLAFVSENQGFVYFTVTATQLDIEFIDRDAATIHRKTIHRPQDTP